MADTKMINITPPDGWPNVKANGPKYIVSSITTFDPKDNNNSFVLFIGDKRTVYDFAPGKLPPDTIISFTRDGKDVASIKAEELHKGIMESGNGSLLENYIELVLLREPEQGKQRLSFKEFVEAEKERRKKNLLPNQAPAGGLQDKMRGAMEDIGNNDADRLWRRMEKGDVVAVNTVINQLNKLKDKAKNKKWHELLERPAEDEEKLTAQMAKWEKEGIGQNPIIRHEFSRTSLYEKYEKARNLLKDGDHDDAAKQFQKMHAEFLKGYRGEKGKDEESFPIYLKTFSDLYDKERGEKTKEVQWLHAVRDGKETPPMPKEEQMRSNIPSEMANAFRQALAALTNLSPLGIPHAKAQTAKDDGKSII